MSDPRRITFGDGVTPGDRPSWCSGALLVVDRDQYRDFERNGVRWVTKIADIPTDGKTSARVYCDGLENALVKNGITYRYGLCSSCAAMEANQRMALREAAARRGDR